MPQRAAPASRRAWSVALGSLTYLLVIGSAFVARSVVVPSAHEFARSVVGEAFLGLAAVALAAVLALGYRARAAFHHEVVGDVVATGAGMPARRAARAVLVAGAALFVLGLSGASFDRRYATDLGEGESFRAGDPLGRQWTFTSQGTSRYQRQNRAVLSVALLPSVAGRRRPFIKPEQRQFFDSEQRDIGEPSAKVAVQSTAFEDVYVVLREIRGTRAQLEIGFRPLVAFIWAGGAMMVLGGLLTLAAEPARRVAPDESAAEPGVRDFDREAEAAITRWRARTMTCPNCGPRPEGDAAYCSTCGLPLEEP